MVVCVSGTKRWDVFASRMIYSDEQQICVHQQICRGRHQICADHTMRFVEVRKLVHFTKFLPPKRGFCPVGNLHPAKKLCNFFSSSWSPDIDGIRWQNSSGADSRLIVPLPRRPLTLQQQVTHIHPSHIFEQAYMKIHSGKKAKKYNHPLLSNI